MTRHTKKNVRMYCLRKGGAPVRTTQVGSVLALGKKPGWMQQGVYTQQAPSCAFRAANRALKNSQLVRLHSVQLTRGKDRLLHPYARRIQIILLVLALVLCLIVGGSLAYFTAENQKTHVVPLAVIELSLDEAEWDPDTGSGYYAGLTEIKDPTLTAQEGSMYTRICMKVQENVSDGEEGATTLITNPARLELIEGILYADTQNELLVGVPYSKDDIAATSGVKPLFDPAHFLAPSRLQPGLYYFEYNGIMSAPLSATLFNKVVIPSDYTRDQLDLMGNFIITLEGQGIQSAGFDSQHDAMLELDKVVDAA